MPFSKKYYVIDTPKCPFTVPLLPFTMATSTLKLICITAMGILKFYYVCVYVPKQHLLLFSYLSKCYTSLHIFSFEINISIRYNSTILYVQFNSF